MKQIRSTQRSK